MSKQLTNEVKFLIQDRMGKLSTEVVEAIYIGQCETMSPNDAEFWSINEQIIDEAQEFLVAELHGDNPPTSNKPDKE